MPTFLGQAYIALSKLLDYRLPIAEKTDKAAVTTDGDKYAVLVTNSGKEKDCVRFVLEDLRDASVIVKEFRVDAMHNNVFIDHSIDGLHETGRRTEKVLNASLTIEDNIDALGFVLWIIEKDIK